MRRRTLGLAIGAALALILTACAGLPTTGPVNAGQAITDDESDSDFVFNPDRPSVDATPQQIVEGFIAAGSGATNSWATAREFLAPELRDVWKPQAGVTVYAPGQRELTEAADDEFTLTVSPVATVDDVGELSTSADGGEIPLTYKLAQQSDGQWRITQAPDGVVLDRNRFTAVYNDYTLQFFDPSWTYLVPDIRWFPRVNAATSIAEELVDGGPAGWLDGAAQNAFTDGARLAQPSVPVRSGVAEVSLQEGARALEQTVLDRMQTQLEASLTTATNIVGVDMLVDDQLVAADAVTPISTRIDSRPLVRTEDAFGFASGDAIEQIAGLSTAVMGVATTDIEVSADRTLAAVRDADGVVSAISSNGTVTTLDDAGGLVAPSVDPQGFIWTVPRDDPASVVAYRADGTSVEPTGAWPGAAVVLTQRVSRDGTRLAAVVRDGDGYALWVAGILRDRDGTPTGLGERKLLVTLAGQATALTWLDASTLGVVVSQDDGLYLVTQSVGGFSSMTRAPGDVTTVSGGVQSGSVRLRDAAGELYGQRGSTWQHVASGIEVLAIQQGAP